MNTPKINDGGPAFPVLEYSRSASGDLRPEPTIQCGMSLRDWFAGMVLLGLNAGRNLPALYQEEVPTCAAKLAYEQADAMMAERSKNAQPA